MYNNARQFLLNFIHFARPLAKLFCQWKPVFALSSSITCQATDAWIIAGLDECGFLS